MRNMDELARSSDNNSHENSMDFCDGKTAVDDSRRPGMDVGGRPTVADDAFSVGDELMEDDSTESDLDHQLLLNRTLEVSSGRNYAIGADDMSSFSYELQQAHKILKDLMSDSHKTVIGPFLNSVETQVHDLKDYYEVIKKPIWLQKVKEKYLMKEYNTITEVIADIRLMLENCYRYHGPNSTYTKKGIRFEQMLEQKLALLPRELRDKTTLEATYGRPCEETTGTRRRSTRHSLEYTSFILNQVRHEHSLRDKEAKRKQSEEKKAVKEEKEKGIIDWECATLLAEPLRTQLRAMWELPQIGHFLYLGRNVLKMPEVSIYELERILVMPRASTLLPRIMTSLLSNPHQRVNLERKPAMPYKVWQNRLQGRVQYWYKILQAREYRTDLVFQQLGVEADFFRILGSPNPLLQKNYHELTFHQRVWLLKTLCDYVLHSHRTVQDSLNEQTVEDMREYVLGSDAKGNTYLHFPQFCGQDLRIYRQFKVNRLPSPCRWGALPYRKRKPESDAGSSSSVIDIKKAKTDASSPPDPVPEIKTEHEEESSKLDAEVTFPEKPPNAEDETSEADICPEPPSLMSDGRVKRSESPASSSADGKNMKRSESPQPVSSPAPSSTSSLPTPATRRSLRLSKVRMDLTEMESHKSSSTDNEGGSATEVDDSENEEDNADDDLLEPDINKFELVVDSVDALRELITRFKGKVEPAGGGGRGRKGKLVSSRPKCEVVLCERLSNLLTELEPWEVKLQKATNRLRLKLKREWEDFVDKDEEGDEDIWGSDRESNVQRSDLEDSGQSDDDRGSSSSSSGEEYRPEERKMPAGQMRRANQLEGSSRAASNDNDDDDDDDTGEYRTRNRLRQLRYLKQHPNEAAKFRSRKQPAADAVVGLNGLRNCNLEMIRNYSKQNTTSQAKELFAWETLRQILVPTPSSVESANKAVFSAASSSAGQPLDKLLVRTPTKNLPVTPEKKNLTKAEVDILGAIQAATLMAKKQDHVEAGTDHRVASSGSDRFVIRSSVISKISAGLDVARVPNSVTSPMAVRSNVVPPPPPLVRSCTMSTSTFGRFEASPLAEQPSLTGPSCVVTKQHLSELSSIAENTENLREILEKGDHRAVATSTSVHSSLPTRLVAVKGKDGKLVYYQVSPGQQPGNSVAATHPTLATGRAGMASLSKQTQACTGVLTRPSVLSDSVSKEAPALSKVMLLPVADKSGKVQYVSVSPGGTRSKKDGTGGPAGVLQSPPRTNTAAMQSSPLPPSAGSPLGVAAASVATSSGSQQVLLIPMSNHDGQTVYLQLPASQVVSASPERSQTAVELAAVTPTVGKTGKRFFTSQMREVTRSIGKGAAVNVIVKKPPPAPVIASRPPPPPLEPVSHLARPSVAKTALNDTPSKLPPTPHLVAPRVVRRKVCYLPTTTAATSAQSSRAVTTSQKLGCSPVQTSSETLRTAAVLQSSGGGRIVQQVAGSQSPAGQQAIGSMKGLAGFRPHSGVSQLGMIDRTSPKRDSVATATTSVFMTPPPSTISPAHPAIASSEIHNVQYVTGQTTGVAPSLSPTNVSVGGVSLDTLLATNPTLVATIQKLAATGHRVILSQQGGNYVLHAVPSQPEAAAAALLPPLQQHQNNSLTPVLNTTNVVVRTPPQPQGGAAIAVCQPLASAVCMGQQPVFVSVAQQQQGSVLAQPAIVTRAPLMATSQISCVVQPQVSMITQSPMVSCVVADPAQLSGSVPQVAGLTEPGLQQQVQGTLNANVSCAVINTTPVVAMPTAATQASIKSKLVMIRESNSDRQMLGLLLDSGQVVPLNATISVTNNTDGIDVNAV